MRIPLSIVLLGTLAAAQTPIVSPIVHTNLEGTSNNTWPWSATFRYQQLHTDLRGSPRPMLGMAWRRNQDQFVPSNAAKTFDMEVFLGDTDAATWSTNFASNYIGAPVNVLLRRQVNSLDWRPAIGQRPAPFDFGIQFDVPFIYTGLNDLVYEVVVHSLSSTGTYQCDAVAGTAATASIWASYSSEGTGCTTSNGSFLLRSQIHHVLATSTTSLGWNFVAAPATSTGAVLLGLAPINVPVNGLCSNLYTDGSLLSLPISSAANGTGATTPILVPYNPTWVGAQVTAQAACLDQAQPGIQIAVSQGLRCEMPVQSAPAVTGARLWALNNPAAVTGSNSPANWLVTQFR